MSFVFGECKTPCTLRKPYIEFEESMLIVVTTKG
jgi:hypothetical protein